MRRIRLIMAIYVKSVNVALTSSTHEENRKSAFETMGPQDSHVPTLLLHVVYASTLLFVLDQERLVEKHKIINLT